MPPDFSRAIGKLVFPDKPRSAAARYGIAILLPFISILIVESFFTVSRAPFFVLFTISVLLAAMYGGWRAGLVATATSAFANAFAIEPKYSILISDPENVARLLVFCLGGCVVSALIGVIEALQHKLEVEREWLRITIASIGDAVVTTDTEGRITFLNAVAEDVTGWTAADASGKPLEEVFRIVNESTRATVENPVRKVFQMGRVVGLANHTILIRKNGTEVPIDDSAAPIRDVHDRIVGAVLVFRDVSEQRHAQAVMVNAQKLASVGRLAATIAHEVNNPLESVTNLLFLAKASQGLEDSKKYLEIADQELRRASEITKQVLTFAKREDKRDLINVEQVVDSVLALYKNKIDGKNVVIQKRCAPSAMAFASRSELRQVIGNLVSNALDAVDHGGSVHIRVRPSSWTPEPAVRIVIADSGKGIPRDLLSRLFEPFVSTKSDTGTGLGLWVTRQIVEAHKGRISLRSRVARGTVVLVCWPTEGVSQAAVSNT